MDIGGFGSISNQTFDGIHQNVQLTLSYELCHTEGLFTFLFLDNEKKACDIIRSQAEQVKKLKEEITGDGLCSKLPHFSYCFAFQLQKVKAKKGGGSNGGG